MPKLSVATSSVRGPWPWRPEDRVFCGEHTWVMLSGTECLRGPDNEAAAAATLAEELVARSSPPTLDVLHASFMAMDRAVAEWRERPMGPDEDVLWGTKLDAVALTVSDDAVLIAHVGLARAYLLVQRIPDEPLVPERLTTDHSRIEQERRRSTYTLAFEQQERDRDRQPFEPCLDDVWFSSLGHGAARIDFVRTKLRPGSRFVLVSDGARRALEAPFEYVRELRTPAEAAERICIEGRARAGVRPNQASAIVIDVDPSSAS